MKYIATLPPIAIGICLLVARSQTAAELADQRVGLLIAGGGMLGIGLLFFVLMSARAAPDEAACTEVGAWVGRARIKSLEPKALWRSDTEAGVSLELEVSLPGQPSFDATWVGVVDQTYAGQLAE